MSTDTAVQMPEIFTPYTPVPAPAPPKPEDCKPVDRSDDDE